MAKERENKGARPVGAVIARNLPPIFQMAFKLAQMEREWSQIVGLPLGNLTRPDSMDRGTLIIACETPAAAQMVNMSSATLIRRVKNRVGIELPGVRATVKRAERRPVPKQRPPRKYEPSQREVSLILATIPDSIKQSNPEAALSMARAQAAAEARFGKGRKRAQKASSHAQESGQESTGQNHGE